MRSHNLRAVINVDQSAAMNDKHVRALHVSIKDSLYLYTIIYLHIIYQ